MNNSQLVGRVGLLLSSAAATVALLSGCGSDDSANETSVPATTPASSTPATTSAPSLGSNTPVSPPPTTTAGGAGGTGAGGAPSSVAPTTGAESGGPSQTVTGGNSAVETTVRTPSPPTGDSMPGDNAPPQGNPGSPGRN
ncbi:hypothetical protein CIW49_06430 [Mycolicibacterium sp. P1-18]|uniref:hypothetical protein n=1 Tax=Mycolicibacterium sp. P1-18 TaxID=2024615 RepID=UPI0011F2E56E|nr:hypothetical protein [Mycolicibacterium sp. P1-18]KAA0101129.1 hypothetical protein CIW49_06430 [Mycolicibacterium sp. P1-18]